MFFEGIQVLYVCNSAFSDLYSATEKLGKSLGMRLYHMQPILTSEFSTLMHQRTVRPPPTLHGYRRHEREKRRAYEQRVLEVEHGTFAPLVLSTSGGWGPSATVAFKRLAGLISEKYDQPYSSTLSFIRCKIAFSLIDSAISCLCSPKPAFHAPARDFNLTDYPLDLIRAEVQLEA